jgi:hypothetical protein
MTALPTVRIKVKINPQKRVVDNFLIIRILLFSRTFPGPRANASRALPVLFDEEKMRTSIGVSLYPGEK